ncbi:MAG: AAA family ATPase [Microbacteriaceae bacterium]|nr:AAA family ATPase [Microbacteriaceae bacterium]
MSRFILVTSDSEFEQRVKKAVSGGLTGGLRVITTVELPSTPHELLAPVVGEPAEVVLLGPGVTSADALRLAAVFDIQLPEISIVLVAESDPELTLAAMRAGIRDLLAPTSDPETIRVLIERACRSAASRGRKSSQRQTPPGTAGQVIVVASPKGGVGKTTLAINVAVELGRIEPMSTVLVDLDAQFGDVASALQLEPEHTLFDAVTGAAPTDSMVLKAFLSVHHSSIYALCGPSSPADADLISGDAISHLLEQLAGEFRFVVIDTAPGLGEHALAALERATDVVLVCAMDVPSVRGLRKEIDVLDKLGLATGHRRVVVNFADRSSGLSIRDIEETIGTKVDIAISRSRELAFSTNNGIPLLQRTARGAAAKQLKKLTAYFDPDSAPLPRKGIHKRAELT